MSNARVRITFLPSGVRLEDVGCGAVYNSLTGVLTVPNTVIPSVLISFFSLNGVGYSDFEPVGFEFSDESTHGRPKGGR